MPHCLPTVRIEEILDSDIRIENHIDIKLALKELLRARNKLAEQKKVVECFEYLAEKIDNAQLRLNYGGIYDLYMDHHTKKELIEHIEQCERNENYKEDE